MKKILSTMLLTAAGAGVSLYAQSEAKEAPLRVSGLVQIDAKLPEGEQSPTVGVRRGFLRTAYATEWGQAVVQINATESGVNIKDAFIRLQAPGVEWVSFRAGLLFRPFGYEVSYAAAPRETPERVRVITSLFPDERDVGAVLALFAPKKSAFSGLQLELGMVNGNGIAPENKAKYGDVHKDFVGHLSYGKVYDRVSFGVGASYYNGRVMLFANEKQDGAPFHFYDMTTGDTLRNTGKPAGYMIGRSAYGVEGQLTVKTVAGNTTLRTEYLFGRQPGLFDTNVSNCANGYLNRAPGDVYLRPFSGAYVYFIQDVFSPLHTVVCRYDYYDPNRRLSGDNLLTDGDVRYATFGAGYMFNPSPSVRLMAFYEWITNETSHSTSELVSAKFQHNLKDNMLTVRVQYRF